MTRLLKEYIALEYDSKLIKENREAGRPIVLNGIIQKSDTLNQNNRLYTKKILEREVSNYQKIVNENRALGTLDHEDSAQISLEKVSHKINKIWWEGNNVCGEIQLLDTPKGKIAQELVLGNCKLGISSRGLGEVHKNSEGVDVVDEDFSIISWDLVCEPSTPGAWLNLRESKEIDLTSVPKSYRIRKILNDILK